ncbi:hypothetical protein PFISCL1PPCAC_4538, partial [Pristionchus fissidentatus]
LTRLKFEPAAPERRPSNAPSDTLPHGQIKYMGGLLPIFHKGVTDTVKICDPDTIKPPLPRDNFHVLPVKDPSRMVMDCSNHKKERGVAYDYRLLIQQKEEPSTEALLLVCETTSRTFKAKTNEPLNDTVIDQSDFAAYCAVEIDQSNLHPWKCDS